jgi:hypothetical protein
MQREALTRAAAITGLTVGVIVGLFRAPPDAIAPLGGALVVLVPACVDAWAFFARLPRGPA